MIATMTAGEPRPWVLEMPAGMELLNSNHRYHWRKENRIKKPLRETACWLARAARIPAMQRARMVAVYEPPDRRRRDPANLYPSWKAVVDGVVDAGVLPDDDSKHLDGPYMELSETVHPKGRLVLYVYELTDAPPAPSDGRPFRLIKKPVRVRSGG
ncbi:hypothetical protein ACWDRB_47730 [Nonomuraea sp. NPDC003707]